jgi:hypothetical protein
MGGFGSLALSGCGAGSFREARRWVEELRVLPSASGTSVARAKALNAAAILAWGDGETATARGLAEQSVALCRELGRGHELAHALQTLGANTVGDQVSMEAMYEEATQLLDREGDPSWMALTRLRHSIASAQRGATSSARAYAAEAAQRFERVADDFFLGRSYLQFGLAQLQLGELAEARVHFEASLTAIRHPGGSRLEVHRGRADWSGLRGPRGGRRSCWSTGVHRGSYREPRGGHGR